MSSDDILYVCDPETHRAWGPFRNEKDTKLFCGRSPYVYSWCIVLTYDELLWYKNITIAHPGDYSPGMAKIFPKETYTVEMEETEV